MSLTLNGVLEVLGRLVCVTEPGPMYTVCFVIRTTTETRDWAAFGPLGLGPWTPRATHCGPRWMGRGGGGCELVFSPVCCVQCPEATALGRPCEVQDARRKT